MRKEERIVLTNDLIDKTKFDPKRIFLLINKSARRSIIKEVSFSGVKLITSGTKDELENKDIKLVVDINKQKRIVLSGCVVRVNKMENADGLVSLGIKLNDQVIPLSYKSLITNFYTVLNRN